MRLLLHGYWRSSATWRVRIALHVKGLPFEIAPVHLVKGEQREGAHRTRNPMEQVPVLELDGRRVTQSLAIVRLLDDLVAEPSLQPSDPFPRARAWELAEIVNAGTQPLQNLYVLQKLKDAGQDEQAWGRHFIARGLAAYEALAAPVAGRFSVGDQVTVADACLIPQLYNARRFAVDLTPYPTLTRVESNALALPAFQAAAPEVQPDAPRSE